MYYECQKLFFIFNIFNVLTNIDQYTVSTQNSHLIDNKINMPTVMNIFLLKRKKIQFK